MKKLIIHIGYPKTATTSLQQNLFSNLHRNGKIEYLNHLGKEVDGFGNTYCKYIIQSIISNQNYNNNQVQKELQQIAKIDKDISVISAETISVMYPGFDYTYLNSNATHNAKKLRDIFDSLFDEIEILVGIRAQVSIIRSCYKQWYNYILTENREFKNIINWIDVNLNDVSDRNLIFNYNLLLQEYIKIFGKGQVHIIVYEDLLNEKDEYYRTLADVLYVNIDYIKRNLNSEIKNASTKIDGNLKTDNPTFGQLIIRPFKAKIKNSLNADYFNNLKKLYKTIIPKRIRKIEINHSELVRELTSKEKNIIFNKYKNNNLQLVKNYNLDIDRLRQYEYI